MTEGSDKVVKVKAGSFATMGLDKFLFQGLTRMQYKAPTPIQRKALPVALAGMDVVCMARTGSGKTAVFLIPLVQKLKKHKPEFGVRGLLLAPSRELALQTFKFAVDMAKFTDLRIISIVGGDGIEAQFDMLSHSPDIIIATPGRLMHHLREISTFRLKHVQYLVFDEADRLFEMGFAEQLNEIVKACPEERQTLLFSATMPKQIIQFSRAGLKDPQLLRLDQDSQLSAELRLANFLLRSNEKMAALLYLVRIIIPDKQSTIIFTATRHHSELIHHIFNRLQLKSTMIYGAMDQDARTMNLRSFRNNEVNFLIVTDVAARGIDIPMLHNVINYHYPPNPKLFVHRCGRAARQGRVGYAFSLVEPEELAYMMDVHFFLNRTLSSGYPEFDTAQSSSRSSENGPETDEAAVSIVTGEDEPLAAINKVVSIGPYTRDKMTPDMVHTGLLVQDSIDEENEFVKRFIEEDIQMTNQYRVCENAMKQYHKTRTEATRAGVKAAKLLVKSNAITTIHPLIAGTDVSRCHKGVVEKAAFVRALQTFRPSQTVLETGIGTGSSNNKAQKKALEKANKLQSRTGPNGSKNILPGVEVMQQLRKVMSSSLERSKPKVVVSLGADADADVDAAEGAESEGRDVFAGFDDDDTALAGDDDEYDPHVLQTSDAGRKALAITPSGSGANFRTSRTITSWSGVVADDNEEEENVVRSVTMGSSSNPEPKQRLSVADRKKLKKYGEIPEHAPSSSSASSSAVGVKRSREEEVMASVDTNVFKDKSYYMSYGTEDVRENFAETSLQPQSHLRASEQQSANILEQSMLDVIPEEILELNKKRRLLRWDAKKRKFVKQTVEEMAEQGGKSKRIRTESGVLLKNSKVKPGEMYAKWKKKTQRDVSLPAQTSGFGVNNHVASETEVSTGGVPQRQDYRKGFGGGRGGPARNNFNNNNKVFEDTEGRKGKGKGGDASSGKRNSAGKIKAAVKFGTGAHKPVSASGQKQRKSNFDAPEASLNFKANAHVKSELKSKAEIKKAKATKADNALKNMSKEKRAHVVGKMKQAKKNGPMDKKALLATQRGGKKKSRVYVR